MILLIRLCASIEQNKNYSLSTSTRCGAGINATERVDEDVCVCDGVNKKIVRTMFREFVSFIVRL